MTTTTTKTSISTTRTNRGLVAAVLALAAGTAGAIALVGAPLADAATATQRVVVRPVTASGHAAPGWQVKAMSGSVSCDSASAGAVSNGIAYCGPSADYAVACWHAATTSRVYCLPDPRKHTLWRIRLDGAFPRVTAPRHPSPQALATRVGGYYLVRDGGAGPMLAKHPTWVSQYYGANNGRFVGGPRSTDGVNRRHPAWFVTTFRTPNQQGLRQAVARAYYVGTAR